MKKRLILEIVCAIIIFIVGYFVGDSAAINRVNKSLNSTDSNQTSSTKADDNSNANSSEQNQKKSDTKVYKFGEEGISDSWAIKILNVQETNTIAGGDSADNKSTSQKFVVVKLQLTNKSQTARQYSNDDFILGDSKTNSQYKSNMEAGETANQKETIYNENQEYVDINSDVNPNTPKQTYIVFEVPKNFDLKYGVLAHVNNDKAVWFNLK